MIEICVFLDGESAGLSGQARCALESLACPWLSVLWVAFKLDLAVPTRHCNSLKTKESIQVVWLLHAPLRILIHSIVYCKRAFQ